MEIRIDPSVIESIQNMDASDDEKISRLDAYVHEILYNRKMQQVAEDFKAIVKSL